MSYYRSMGVKMTNTTEYTKYWHNPHFDNLQLLHATYSKHSFAKHYHEEYAIGIIESGSMTFYCAGKTYIASAGDVLAINPGEIHSGGIANTKKGWTFRMLYPSVPLMSDIAQELGSHNADTLFFPNTVFQDNKVAKQIRKAHIALTEGSDSMDYRQLFYEAMTTLINRHASHHPDADSPNPYNDMIEHILEYLENHLTENNSLQTLSQLVGLSQFHLVRVFKQYVGLPPHTYLTHLRVIRAKELLVLGNPIADVAFDTGFTDQSHLTRWFKKIVGVTPGQYVSSM